MIPEGDFTHSGIPGDSEYNSAGFRMHKEIDDIDLDNYIMFLGSSHTVGVGVEQEKSFPHLISAVMKCDCVNLAVGGGGIDAVEHNLLMWFLKYDKHPKAIIIEWPIYQRYMKDIHGQHNMAPAGAWDEPKFVIAADEALYIKGELTYYNLHNISPVPIIDVMYSKINNNYMDSYVIWHSEVDKGSDGEHAGAKTHLNTAENIINALDR